MIILIVISKKFRFLFILLTFRFPKITEPVFITYYNLNTVYSNTSIDNTLIYHAIFIIIILAGIVKNIYC